MGVLTSFNPNSETEVVLVGFWSLVGSSGMFWNFPRNVEKDSTLWVHKLYISMWDEIMDKFEGSPSQKEVIKLLLERGFSVNDEGRVVSGGIEIPNTQIAREINVDRRVIDSTTSTILEDEELRDIFQNISSIPSLKDVAPVLGLSVLTVEVDEPSSTGIIAEISTIIADHGISIRQAVSDDPYFSDDPTFTVITNGDIPGDLIEDLMDLDYVKKVDLR